jgi:hypothetical protein
VTDLPGESRPAADCPFDPEYFPLLRPLLFTIVYLGYSPRIASERSDSGENRLTKICELISESKFGIHDLSRLKSTSADEYYRLNMPFELGIDYGARLFGARLHNEKKFLILEQRPHDFRRALSDIAGVDIKHHSNQPDEIIRAVRDWFAETVGLRGIETATVVWYRFGDFTTAFYEKMINAGSPERDIERMPVAEYIDHIRDWVRSAKR